MIARVVTLVVVWVALWGELSIANVVSGVVVALLLGVLFPAAGASMHSVRPLALVRLVWYVAVSLLTSTWRVVAAIIVPTPDRVHAEIFPVRLTTRSPLVASLVANAITLTPGTMSVDCEPGSYLLRVHVLGRTDAASFAADVHHLEQLVAAAIPERRPR